MEPLNCTVRVTGAGKDAKVELWLGTQAPGWEVATAARVLGVAPQNVRVNVQMAGAVSAAVPTRAVTTWPKPARLPRLPEHLVLTHRCA